MEKIILGLSGGVDSAVSAALLQEQGFEVTGVWLDAGVGGEADARAAADALGVAFSVCDIRAELERGVCAPFASAYISGKTPSPCLRCNRLVKFPALLREAERRGASLIATGHYARAEGGRLFKGRPANDQSYMLSMLTREMLLKALFPLGAMEKAEVRRRAEALSLPSAKKPDSMEICFIPDGDFPAYIERRGAVPPPGDFVDAQGRVLGRHRGVHHYTVGQRRGLGIALGERMCVVRIDAGKNAVVLAPAGAEALSLRAEGVNWISGAPDAPLEAAVRIRHSRAEYPAVVTPSGTGAEVRFLSPVPIPAPGQAAVFYRGDEVLGGGEIVTIS